MALITFANKVDSQVTGVAEINKITASNINELKAGVNANEVAVIAASKKTQSFLSDFGAKPDLKYIDIEFVSGTEITCPLDSFVSTDVGKHIAIKNTHHNPNTADGTEFPNSSLGRIITVTTKILSVTDGVATIDFSCSLTANARAYSYTNNFDILQDAVNHAQLNNIETVLRDGEGIYGINPIYSVKYPTQTAIVCDNTFPLKIVGSYSNPFKFCVEDTIGVYDLFQLKQGNYDFTLDGKIIPPDRYSLTFPLLWSVVNTNWNNQYAGNSVRIITIKNIVVTDILDNDGNDSWFCSMYSNTRGGLNNSDKKQIVYFENINIRCRFAGFSSFSQNGNYNTLYHKNVNLQRWSSNATGELGRAAYDNSTLANMNDDNGQWTFENDFTVLGGVLTIDDLTSDFNFNDQQSPGLISTGRTFKVEIGGVEYVSSSVNSPKSINVVGVADGSYTSTWKLIASKNQFGHPFYYHPNQDMYFDLVSQIHDEFWINSSGGVPNLTNNVISFKNCVIERFTLSGASYKPDIYLEDSIVTFGYGDVNSVTSKDSTPIGNLNTNGLVSLGGNDFEIDLILKQSTDFDSHNDTFEGSFNFQLGGSSTLDNYKIISGNNGSGRLYSSVLDYYLIFKNCREDSHQNLEINASIPYPITYTNCNPVNGGFQNQVINLKKLHDNLYFSNSGFPLESSIKKNYNYLNDVPKNRINITNLFQKKKLDATRAKRSGYGAAFGWYPHMFMDIPVRLAISNYYKLTNCPGGVVYDNSITNEATNADWQSGGLSVLTLFEGLVYFEITQENQLNVLADFYDRNGVPLNRNVTYGNVLVKTLERKVGEVVTLEITKDAFLREVSSSISKKYVDAIPTRKGIHKEKVFLNDNISYVYDIETSNIVSEVSTVSLTSGFGVNNSNNGELDNPAFLIDLERTFTIGQNFSDGIITPFTFKLILNDGTELSFDNSGLAESVTTEVNSENSSLCRAPWMYKHFYTGGHYEAYVDNLTGIIFIKDDGSGITLASTNNFEVTGLEVLSESWSRNYEGVGIETLTTIQRNAILTECSEGYEVYDTDLSTRFIKIGSSWV